MSRRRIDGTGYFFTRDSIRNRASEKYWKGTWKKIGDSYDMIERIKFNYVETTVKEVWNEAEEWGKSVLTKPEKSLSNRGS
ncbi:hypothetical protein LQV63_30785 [Paenibacillus profundus]|uniref:Uncharacterized protein n=2 Tax=Paenibacillus profundus TaxID=1173085 RepID=A0ABS8YTF0_9BACL|nr:hypothetical protein [Paenibacillus profundus]